MLTEPWQMLIYSLSQIRNATLNQWQSRYACQPFSSDPTDSLPYELSFRNACRACNLTQRLLQLSRQINGRLIHTTHYAIRSLRLTTHLCLKSTSTSPTPSLRCAFGSSSTNP